jgi:hypothetical protein
VSKLQTILYSFFLACLFLLLKGYHFNTEDQAEHLPQVYALLDSSLYHIDAFVQASLHHFTIRFFYTWFLFGLSYILPLNTICFALTLLCIAAVAWSFYRIAYKLSDNKWAAYLSPLLVLFVFLNFTVGGNVMQYNQFLCGVVGKAFGSLAIVCFFNKRYVLMSFLLGLTSLFHVLVGLQLFLIFYGVLLLDYKNQPLSIYFKSIAAYLSLALFILVPVYFHQTGNTETPLYFNILYSFRNPLHYLPSLFPLKAYCKAFVLLCFGVLAVIKGNVKEKSLLLKIMGVILLGLFTYSILLEVLGVNFIGKLQFFKTTIWLAAMSCIALSVYIGDFIKKVRSLENAEKYFSPVLLLLSIGMIGLMTNSALVPIEKIQGKYMIGNYKKSDLTLLHEWIAANTNKDAVFLTPPDDDSFLCEAKRASALSYKAIIHEPYFLMPWYYKFGNIYGVNVNNVGNNKAIDVAAGLYKTRKYTGDATIMYRIDNFAECTYFSSLGPVVHREGDWVLSVYQ